GYVAGRAKAFDPDQVAGINELALDYALPASLFVGVATIPRAQLVQEAPFVLVVVPRNDEYCILKSFAVLEDTPGVPGLDIPGFDVASIAKGYGCDAARLDDLDAIKKAAVAVRSQSRPTVLEIPISAQVPPLI
ncbi:MAG: hypothetical protein JO075_14950, partial [Acidimicrobiia bacterium]|nr:hypothetical protein [Acidimicrobiia bacterium]